MSIIKGKHAVHEALLANLPLDRIVIVFELKDKAEFMAIFRLAKQQNIKVQALSKMAFERLGEDHTQGILAYVRQANSLELETLLDNQDDFPIVVVLDHIEDPHNMGAILRSCEALGVHAVVYAKDRQCQITPTVSKVSAGATAHLTLVKVTNIAATLEKLSKAGYWIYGSDDSGKTNLDNFRPNFPLAIILGNEHKGMSPMLQKKCHEILRIKLSGQISSLNVSVSAGILLYELTKSFVRPNS